MSFELVKVDDITIPEVMFYPMKTGNSSLDNLFSNMIGGVVPSQVVLVTAMPGAGKSTLCSIIAGGVADWLERQKEEDYPDDYPFGKVVYISREMSDFQLKMMMKDIPNFDKVNLLTGKVSQSYFEYIKYLVEVQPSLVIVDSLQKIADETKFGGKNQKQIDIVNAFGELAKSLNTPVLLIGHVSKAGRYLGPSTIEHYVDSHIHMEIDMTDNIRVVQMQNKNRFGEIHKHYFMEKKDGVYEFYSKEDAETEMTLEDPIDAWEKFSEKNNPSIPDYKQVVMSTFNQLKIDYQEELVDVGLDPEKIKVTFGNGFFNNPRKSLINLDLLQLKSLDLSSLSKSDLEIKMRDNVCEGHSHFVLWYVLREFLKFVNHKEPPTTEFYRKLLKTAQKYFITFNLQ